MELFGNDEESVYSLETPGTGYAALFGEAVFDNGAIPYSFSTTVNIVAAPSAQAGPEDGSAAAVQ